MIHKYKFNYDFYEAEAYIKVDTEKFKEDDAKLLLEFFSWDYNKEANPIDELMKKYALTAIKIATANNFNLFGIKNWFEEQEGFISVDGSQGVEITMVYPYEFDDEKMDMNVEIINN